MFGTLIRSLDVPDTATRLRTALEGRYTIERELGAGGMALVYLAHDVRHDRRVALKVLRPELASVIGAERFLAEIKTTANLQHPHILPLFDSGEVGGIVFYVMPYVDGESLRACLEREKQLSIGTALRIAREVSDALTHAHARGIIHRDIKPENIMLQGGHALVADFGIALAVANTGAARLTETGMSLGTPHYMSPEQAMGERTLDARTDIYALGCVVYEMLAGEPPFTGATAQAIVARVLTDEPRPLRELRHTVPPAVDDAVLTALQKLPADRFATAGEFAAALSTDDRVPTRRLAHRVETARRSPRDVVLAVLLVVTAIGALAWGLTHAAARPPVVSAPLIRFHFPAEFARMGSGSAIGMSPDGSQLALVQFASEGLTTRLALRRLDRDEIVVIPGTEGALSPFFSPDGHAVAYAEGPRLKRVGLNGEQPTILTDLGGADIVARGTWAPNGTIFFTSRRGQLFRVSAAGGTAERIAQPPTGRYDAPIWLPGGRILVSSQPTNSEDFELVVLSVETGRVLARLGRGLGVQYVETGGRGYVTFVSPNAALTSMPFDAQKLQRDGPNTAIPGFQAPVRGRSLLAAVSATGTVAYATNDLANKELVLVSTAGESVVLPAGIRAFRGPRFSPDGRRITVDVEPGGDLVGDVWVLDRQPGTFTRLTFEGSSVFPEWTPDGSAVLYSAVGKSGSREIYRVPADRSAAPSLVIRSSSPIFEAVQSSDNTLLYRETADSTGRDIVRVPAQGKPTSFATSPFQEVSPAISPDGRLVLYMSDESGRDEIYVRPMTGAGRVQVSSTGGTEPRWGPGGREAYYWSKDTLFAVSITPSPALAVEARRVVLTGRYSHEPFHSNYDVSPDGKHFVFVRPTDTATRMEVTVLLNWFGHGGQTNAP